jgi:FkbM family methyltransferase
MFNWRFYIQTQLQKFGYELVRYPIMHFLHHYGINLVLDVGANTGQYGKDLRRLGYKGKIVSFEPLSSAYRQLARNVSGDSLWETAQFALGCQDMQTELNVAEYSPSSSLLKILPELPKIVPGLSSVGKENISVHRLDSIFSNYCAPENRIFLKIDTQGYEKQVLEGALNVLPLVLGLQIEMRLAPVYAGEALIEELFSFMRQHGFTPQWIIHGYKHPVTRQLLEIDGIFINEAFIREK